MATVKPRSPVGAVKHGLALLAIIWQGLFMVSEVVGGLDAQWEPAYFIAITCTWLIMIGVTWGPLADSKLRDVGYLINVVMLLAWAGVFFLLFPDTGSWQHGASITNIAVGLIGFLVATRMALIVIALVAIGEVTALVVANQSMSAQPSLGVDVLYGVYAITIGYVSMLARLALLRAAGRAEIAQANLLTEQVHVRAMQDATRQLDEDERRVHATVLNTLTAFARGSLHDQELIRMRAEESVGVLRDLIPQKREQGDTGATPWRSRIAGAVDRAKQAGLDVRMQDRMKQDPPPQVGLAFATALEEAVSNVIRHSHANEVIIELSTSRRDGFLVVVRDDGVGLPAQMRQRFGIRHGMQLAMQDIGGTAEVIDRQPSGVAVLLRWRKRPPDAVDQSDTTRILASFAAPVLGLMWVFVTLRFLISLDEYSSLGVVFAAYLWYSLLVVLLFLVTRRGLISPPVMLSFVVAAPLVYVGQTAGLSPSSDAMWAAWSSEAVVSILLVLIGVGPWWAFAPVLGMWVLMQGDVLAEIIAPGFVILVATAFFARSVRRNLALLHDSLAEQVRINASALTAAQHMEALSQRFEITRIGDSISLLSGIADGSIDVHDEHIQAAAMREERLIRSVLRLNPQRSNFDRFLGELAQLGYELGRDVEIDTQSGISGVPDNDLASFRSIVEALLRASDPTRTTRLTIAQHGQDHLVRFVVSCVAEPDSLTPMSPAIAAHRIEGEATWLVEWRVAHAHSDR
jgi:signal transduction histidine kinase